MKVVTVEEMRRIEAASDAAGHSYAAMMEQAGRAVAEAIMQRKKVRGRDILVLVGSGNNGGDGLVAARYLAQAGACVTCYLLRPRDPAVDQNFRLAQAAGALVVLADEDREGTRLQHLVTRCDILLDALLGTGTHLPLRGTAAQVLQLTRQTLEARRRMPSQLLTPVVPPPALLRHPDGPFIVAVDGPSGLDYNSGSLDNTVIPADLTITFAYPKTGHFRFPGAAAVGELVVADIGTDPALAKDVALELVTPAMVQAWLPPRPPDAHKGTFGKALIVAGSLNYTGAACLAGAAAVRAGVGLVTMALPAAIHSAVASHLLEATYLPLPYEQGFISAGAAEVLLEHVQGYDALLLGPGLGRSKGTEAFVRALLESRTVLPPLVLDADGLNIVAGIEGWAGMLPPATILTPHPGEMARLTGRPTGEIQADRVATACSYAALWKHVVVLKGAYTVIAAPDGGVVIEPFANPGLAKAGTGDVLAGTIVALRAQGMNAFQAAVAGAYLHGLAGELALASIGAVGMAAGDVLAHLTHAWKRLCGP